MFQSFTGNSRRPRQVNLSGQEPNAFAGWGSSPTASGIQKTVAVAQAERQHRQQERDRLNATKRIQRTWRGHRSRRNLASMRRQEWDDLENNGDEQDSLIPFKANQQLRLLLAFFNADNPRDIGRLSRFGDRLLKASKEGYLLERDKRPQLFRLANIILASLAR
jgi:ubiquitin-protein ligase E3 C